MSEKRETYSSKANLPLYLVPLVFFFGLLIAGILFLFGIFIAIVVGTTAIGIVLLRLLNSFDEERGRRVEDDGNTIILEEGEFKVIDSDEPSN